VLCTVFFSVILSFLGFGGGGGGELVSRPIPKLPWFFGVLNLWLVEWTVDYFHYEFTCTSQVHLNMHM
jgi:hypothetical protein